MLIKCEYFHVCTDRETEKCKTCKNNKKRNAPKSYYKSQKDNAEAKRAMNGRYITLNYFYSGHDGSTFECPVCGVTHNGWAVPGDNPNCPECGAPLTHERI